MDRSIEYVQVTTNFNSAYNIPLNVIQPSPTYTQTFASFASSPPSHRPPSPLFHRCKSPPPRIPLSTGSVPKFNFDLYKMNNKYDFDRDSLSSGRSPSPPSTRRIYHHPMYSSASSSPPSSPSLSKLRQINTDLSQTLARSESTGRSPIHYHIHHYPLSQYSSGNYRSRSTSEERASLNKYKVSPKLHKARVTYKIHIPRRHRKSSHHTPASDIHSSDNPATIDLYPTHDHGFVKKVRKTPDNQSPWVVKGTSIRHHSNSDTNTSQLSTTPRESYHDNKSTKSHRRSIRDSERSSSAAQHQSSHVSSRGRPDSAPFYTSDQHQQSNSSHRRSKQKHGKHNYKPDENITTERSVDEIELKSNSKRKNSTNQSKILNENSQQQKHLKNVDNTTKSVQEPPETNLPKPLVKESEPSKPTTTDKNSTLNESKSQNHSVIDNHSNSIRHGSFVDDQLETERSNNQESSRSPTHAENPSKSQQIQSPSNETVKTTTQDTPVHQDDANNSQNKGPISSPTSDANQTKTKDNNKANEESPRDQHLQSPTSQISSPKIPKSEQKITPQTLDNDSKSKSMPQDDTDENDQEVAQSFFDLNKFLSDASKSIFGPPETVDSHVPAPAPSSHPKPTEKSPVHRKNAPPSPPHAESDDDLYNPPFGPNRKNERSANLPSTRSSSLTPSPPPLISVPPNETDAADDFFS